MSLRVFVSAGEHSGDRHAAALVRALRERAGEVTVRGLGGEHLAAEGAELLARVDDLAVIGFVDVAKRLPYFLNLMRRVQKDIAAFRPDVVIPVDYPGFNLPLGRRARKAGHRVVYYIAPQVWAWRRERRPGIRRAVDHLMVVFPFEEPLFREAEIPTTFVGHPLLDAPPGPNRDAVRAQLGIPHDAPLLALLPGSRAQEVTGILPDLAAAAERLRADGVHTVVSRASGLPHRHYASARRVGLPFWDGPAAHIAHAADAAIVASGTATLETGLQGTPLAVVYRTGRINWMVAKRVVSVSTVGLVNIAADGDRVPELLQDDLTPDAVVALARRLLFDETERREQTAYLATLRERLGGGGAARRAARTVLEQLGRAESA